MQFETLNEEIEVITYFDNKQMRPLRFRWRSQTYHVSRINGMWYDVIGRDREYHFHVATRESGSFELVYNSGGFVWKIGRVCLED